MTSVINNNLCTQWTSQLKRQLEWICGAKESTVNRIGEKRQPSLFHFSLFPLYIFVGYTHTILRLFILSSRQWLCAKYCLKPWKSRKSLLFIFDFTRENIWIRDKTKINKQQCCVSSDFYCAFEEGWFNVTQLRRETNRSKRKSTYMCTHFYEKLATFWTWQEIKKWTGERIKRKRNEENRSQKEQVFVTQ